MSAWLDPLRTALDAAGGEAGFFFRDDDAGWDDEGLFALLACFDRHQLPIDLAVIPAALGPRLAQRLLAWREQRPGRLGLHQHGYAHVNHEATGRKCEFGPGRDPAAQAVDLAAGASLLAARLGLAPDPIFTPPWNRCTGATAAALTRLGFRALSRDAGATPIAAAGLAELPVAVDWCKRVEGAMPAALAARLAAAVASTRPIGIMLHHAVMDEDERARLGEVLAVLARHPACRCRPMGDWVRRDG